MRTAREKDALKNTIYEFFVFCFFKSMLFPELVIKYLAILAFVT